MADWETSQEVLMGAKLIENSIDLAEGFTNSFWKRLRMSLKRLVVETSQFVS